MKEECDLLSMQLELKTAVAMMIYLILMSIEYLISLLIKRRVLVRAPKISRLRSRTIDGPFFRYKESCSRGQGTLTWVRPIIAYETKSRVAAPLIIVMWRS